jgi:hypothetical protein
MFRERGFEHGCDPDLVLAVNAFEPTAIPAVEVVQAVQ